MPTLKVTAKGQITLNKEIMKHLGVKPGDRLEVDTLPDGGIILRSVAKGDLEGFFGSLHRPGDKAVSIDEMNETIRKGWAGEL